MADVVTFGECMVRLTSPRVGPMRHATSLDVGVAGAEANVAIGLVRLGASVAWSGRVGDDEFGRLIASTLAGEGVQTRAIVDDAAKTGLLFKERRTLDRNRVTYYRDHSAGSRFGPDDLDEQGIAEARVLHLTGITAALGEEALAACERAVDIARANGTQVSLDLNVRRGLWSDAVAGPVLTGLARKADIVFATEDEARVVASGFPLAETPELATAIADLGPTEVLIKRGADGALLLADGTLTEAPIFEVTALDPVGAGDAFSAGYLSERIVGASAFERLTTAAKCGAFAVTVDGDWEGLPSRSDLDTLGFVPDVHR